MTRVGAFDVGAASSALERDPSGIWRARAAGASAVSFPETGHAACLEIEDASFWFSHRNACIGAALARAGARGPFLDVGAGNGFVSRSLAAQGLEPVALEPGEEGATNARRRGLASVVCAKLEDARFEAGTFRSAGAFDVVEHVADDVGLLREIRRVLGTGGVLGVTVPAHAWLWSAEDDLAGHHRRYSLGSLRETLARAGFEVSYASYFFAPLVGPLFVARSVPFRLRRGARRSTTELEAHAAAQHVPSANVRRVAAGILAPEVALVAAGRVIPFGTSCLAVAVAS